MNWDINVVAGLVAGVAAMVPGAIIYSPQVLGNAWMKEIKHKPGEGGSPGAAVAKMFVTSLINGLVASLIVWSAGAHTFADAVKLTMLFVGWFWISANLMLVFFENRSWKWFRITALSHVFTAAVIGIVLGLFVK
ncbi:MAG TPA: DUF1761 domain-containing protein [Candidatus Saccharimonadia bacterium]|nr:DUF1761 domain-containing protein [Candidatus Saccharimonadia bacterium]